MREDPTAFLPLAPAAFHILLVLSGEDRHGYGILQEVARATGGKYKIGPGTLYDNLAKLVGQGLIEERGRKSADDDPRRRYYRLSALGRGVLAAEVSRLDVLIREVYVRSRRPRRAECGRI